VNAPLWPDLSVDESPTPEEVTAHNLACIAESLEMVADRLEQLCAIGERVSQHLFDLKRRVDNGAP